ncbi:calcium-translocating P-type ATPase, SERCA-type [Longirhabdus pacifica]|uniref:calcium-translocating P-type ATPase, SERCA-type n=1 Tax=Longirhabdus pacifica TaxID=2305227 RepID=UPI001008F4BB|nr:calcium-translocating P-type ATPase, SERCA-type [Longirhabdus pacifica]
MSEHKWYDMKREEVIQTLQVDEKQGLSPNEVKEAEKKYGQNMIVEAEKASPIAIFFSQFKDFMVLVLVVATLISGLLGEYMDAITIIAIILINGILGFIQEFRAERSLQALKQLSAPLSKVMRDGKLQEIPALYLVPGDVVMMESGDRVPADVRLMEESDMYVEESALTGESVPVSKHSQHIGKEDVALGDQKNMSFMGTMVTRGRGKGVVVATGMQTEMGKIAELIQNTETMQTPLQRRLDQLGKLLIAVAIGLTIMVVIAGILHGQPAYGMFLAGVSLAVAAIPEGLPAIVTIALALGVQRMIRRNAVIRKLPSVETLGCASVICSDKTGTITQNKMTVTHLWVENTVIEVTGAGYEPRGEMRKRGEVMNTRNHQTLRRLMQISALCNNAELFQEEVKKEKKKRSNATQQVWNIKGDPTEGALMVLAAKAGYHRDSLEQSYERKQEFPFDSERKCMSVIVQHQGRQLVFAKGAPDVIVDQCTYAMWEGKMVPMTSELRAKIISANEAMARSALRVIGCAFRDVRKTEACTTAEQAEKGLVFAGLTGMIDPPRQEVKQSIQKCKRAGIKTVMITGDHQSTAEAIAKDIGLIPEGGMVINGKQLAAMSDEALANKVEDVYVYARVSPEHKLRIVKAMQQQGHVVAMTGDGVNDAPAIKASDIGISMGITGTDVAKESASLVLRDDHFATIVAAIEEGRSIYENIRKFIRYLLASNVGEILVMFMAMMLGMPLPLVPIQILWVNLVTDGLPAMALGVDQAEDDLMEQQPRNAKENIFARRLGWKILSRGAMIGVCTLAAFWIVLQQAPQALDKAQTVAFSTLVMAQLIHVFDCRSSRSIFHRNMLENRYLVIAVLSSIALLLMVVYVDAFQPIFHTVDLNVRDWILIMIFAAIPTVVFGIGSVLKKNKKGKLIVPSAPHHATRK